MRAVAHFAAVVGQRRCACVQRRVTYFRWACAVPGRLHLTRAMGTTTSRVSAAGDATHEAKTAVVTPAAAPAIGVGRAAAQPGVLLEAPRAARHMFFDVAPGASGADVAAALAKLASVADLATGACVVGVGPPLAEALGATIDGLHNMPDFVPDGTGTTTAGAGAGAGADGDASAAAVTPVTPAALWLWVRAIGSEDAGHVAVRAGVAAAAVSGAFVAWTGVAPASVDCFRHGADTARDLTGYEDGTENPEGEKAQAAGVAEDGSSFAALQQWHHFGFAGFQRRAPAERDATIGRRMEDNEELDDAPPTAHVKRTEQESFGEDGAFVVRRSMPWADAGSGRLGLMFLAFGCSLDAFEAQLRRMVGGEDGTVDQLFTFTRPLTGMTFWCPPLVPGATPAARASLDVRRLVASSSVESSVP